MKIRVRMVVICCLKIMFPTALLLALCVCVFGDESWWGGRVHVESIIRSLYMCVCACVFRSRMCQGKAGAGGGGGNFLRTCMLRTYVHVSLRHPIQSDHITIEPGPNAAYPHCCMQYMYKANAATVFRTVTVTAPLEYKQYINHHPPDGPSIGYFLIFHQSMRKNCERGQLFKFYMYV